MREAEGYLRRFSVQPIGVAELSTIVGGPAAGWRDIATAPKDGTHILACDASQTFGWRDGKPLPSVQTVIHWYEFGEESGWYTSVNEREPEVTFAATHWKPLDDPGAQAWGEGRPCTTCF